MDLFESAVLISTLIIALLSRILTFDALLLFLR